MRYTVAAAEELWMARRPYEAGRVLCQIISPEKRPAWAAGILKVAYRQIPNPVAEIEAVFETARDQSRWHEAHEVFQSIRRVTLQLQNDPDASPVVKGMLSLAEKTAKVTYNASGYPAPFDLDSGWRLVSDASYIVDAVEDVDFAADIWKVVSKID